MPLTFLSWEYFEISGIRVSGVLEGEVGSMEISGTSISVRLLFVKLTSFLFTFEKLFSGRLGPLAAKPVWFRVGDFLSPRVGSGWGSLELMERIFFMKLF